YFFFFSSRRRHTRFSRDWSSDVCSSDLFAWPRVPLCRGRELDANWRARAACAGTASRLYDPWDVPDRMWEAPQDALKMCGRCPVRVECLVDALRHNDHCVRGGTTKRQRDALKRPRWRSKCPVCESTLTSSISGQALQVCAYCGLTWRVPKSKEN